MDFSNVYFLLTPNCNLRCKYCFQEDDYHDRTEAAVTRQVVDDFITFARAHDFKHVELFGGEPLLYKDALLYTVRALRERLPAASVGLVTNGTLLDDEIMALLEDNPVNMLLSLDGRPERHDLFRGGYERISPWFDRLQATGRVNVALQAGRIAGLADQVKFVWGLGFKSVFMNIIQNYGWYSAAETALFAAEYEQAVQAMLAGDGHLICAANLYAMLEKSTVDYHCGITGAGVTCDWRGRFYPCHRAAELGKAFSFGDIYQGICTAAEQRLRTYIYDQSRVSASCGRYPLLSFCPVSVYQQHGDFTGEWPAEFCDILMTKIKIVAKYHYELAAYLENSNRPPAPADAC
jgi:Arylsulfatase regulator (Fe-S oxidoreductase)